MKFKPAAAEGEEAVVEVAEGAAEDLVGAVGELAVSAEVALGRVVAFLAEVESAGQVPDTVAESVEPVVQVLAALVESEGSADLVPEALAESVVRGGLVPELAE